MLLSVNVWGADPVTFGSDWNSLFGTSYNGTISGVKANSLTLEGAVSNVSFVVTNGTSTNGYVKTSDFRAYNGYTITITAPTNNNITAISSTKGGKNFSSGVSANVGTLSISNNAISWSGSSNSVVLSCSGTVSFATITVTYSGGDDSDPSLSVSPATIDFGTVYKDAEIDAKQVEVTFANLTTNDVAAAISGSVFSINKTGSFTSGDKITITPSTATLGEYTETLTLSATGVDNQTVTVTMNVVEAPVLETYNKVTAVSDLADGDVIVLGSTYTGGTDDKLKGSFVDGAMGSNVYLASLPATIADNKLTAAEACEITLGKSGDNWTLTSSEGQIGATAAKKMSADPTVTNYVGSWTISIKDGNASITSTNSNYGTIKYNGSSPRFLNYASGQTDIQIYKKAVAPTNEAVTFAAPENGSLVIKNGATPIATGATIQDGTVLDVTFGMTPAEAYKDVAIKVTKTEGGDDVTSTVYNSETKKITMPRYAITVAVTSTKLYKITLTTDGEGTGTATMNDVTTDIYVDGETQINLVANAVAPNEFTKWSATENISINEDDKAETYAYASGDGTITATFGISELQPLDAPTLSTPTNITYTGVTLNWQELANAKAYNVELLLNDETIASNVIIGETTWTPEVTLQANTTYTYTVQGVGDGTTYADENNPKAQSTVTTADYPAVVLTLSENGNTTPVNGKLNTPITLPTTSTQACDGKVFMGWSENTIDGEVGKDQVSLLDATYTFDNPSVLTRTIYAVYATVVSEGQDSYQKATSLAAGDEVILATETSNAPNTGVTGANSNNKDASVSTTAADWMIFTVEAGSSTGKYKFKNGTSYILATAKNFAMGSNPNEQTLNASSQAIWTNGTDGDYALLINPNQGSPLYRYYKTSNSSYTKFYVWKVIPGEKTYSNYCTTCQAAVAAPTFSLEGGNYSEAQTLTLSATEGDIYYTINDGEETKYTAAIALNNRGTYEISAYAKVDDRTSETVTKTYTLDWAYTLAELVAEGEPTSTGRTVTVILTNEIIESLATSGSYVNGFFTMVGDKKIEVYCKNSPSEWEVGGKVSGTVTCPWKLYSSTWELCPTNWDWASYTAPAKIESLKITGDVTNKNYTAGQKLDFTGLTVTGVYSDATEENVTADVVWTEVTLTENQPEATATATLNNAKTGNVAVNASKTITGLTVGAAKTLESIYVADDSEHKKTFFVGRPFSAEGLKVMAHYNMGDDQQIAVANLNITNTTFSEAEAEHAINISYTENGVEKTTSYNVEVTYMNLNDLVAATDINDHDHVYVKFENVMITKLVNKGILLNVQKGDKDIEIYNQSANCPNTWEQYGTVSATLNNVEWTNYQGTWEFKISNWDVVEYAAPNIPVTSMEISPAEVSVGETKTTTLSIIYDPTNATNTGVTWAVTEGSDYASVDEEGVVTGLAVGTATITATLKADENITATRTVTVTETAKCEISYYVKGEVASTQNIAREEEGTLTYVPELEVAGYTFAGWAEDAIAEETATATLISTYTPAADEATKSVYAIYKRVDDSSPTYQQYAKVTSALTDWSGDYLIAYSDEIFANGQKGGKDDEGAIGKQYVIANPGEALSGNVVTKEWGDQYKVTLEEISAGSNTYVLKTQDGKYNYQTSNANGLTASSTKSTAAQYPISVTFTSENDVKLALGGGAAGAVFRYNTDQYFRYYKNGGQNAVYLYKYDEGSALYTSNPVAKVKVTFNLDGGVGGCGTITVNEGEDVTLCDAAPTKDLNKFKAWSDGVNEYAPSATITNVTEDIELTARWIAKKQYTISFNKGGAAGTTPASIKDYEYNEVTLPAQGDLSNPGYIFGGWNDGETTYAGGASFTMPEKNVSMTAVWVAKTNDKWYLVTSAEQLAAGKQYAIVSNEKETAMGAMVSDKTYMANVDASFNADKSMMIAIDPSAVILTLGGNATDGWTLSNNGKFLGSETVKNMAWSTEVGGDYKWEITIADGEGDYEAKIKNTVGYLCYNAGSPRFTTYSSVQSKVQLYVLVPAQAIDEEVNASTLDDHADVTVNEGGNLVINEDVELGDIVVMEGGKVTLQTTTTLTVNNFVIKSTMGAGQSGQVLGVTKTNFTITSNAYFDVTLGDNANPDKWHAFAVPFNVDAINGIYDLDDNKLTNEVNYAIMSYHGDVRAQGQYGWKKFRGIMNPGTFYLMTVDGERTTYRMKMNGVFSASSTEISVQQYASGITTDAGWNGIANNQLGYSSIGVDVQVLNPTSYTYEVMTASTYNFTVGTPFFYQANATGTIDLTAPNAGENYAPRRVGAAEIKNVAIHLSNAKYTDHLYLSATDEATNEYQIGRDLVKMTMTNTPAVPQIFAEAYGNKLCMVDAPMVNDEATYALNLYAPAAGEYTIGAAQVEGYELFLTQGGLAIWNLSMGETTIELKKGNNNGYGIVIKKAHNTTTDVDNVFGNGENIQKFIFNDNLYIVRDGKVFDAQGKLVK